MKVAKTSIGPLYCPSSTPSTIISYGPPPVLLRHMPDLRSAGISPMDSVRRGHRADGAAPRGPRAQAAAPWSRSLPTRRRSDARCAQPSRSKVALALFSRHVRDPAPLASGASRVASGSLGEPCEALGFSRSTMSWSSSSSVSAGRTAVEDVSAQSAQQGDSTPAQRVECPRALLVRRDGIHGLGRSDVPRRRIAAYQS